MHLARSLLIRKEYPLAISIVSSIIRPMGPMSLVVVSTCLESDATGSPFFPTLADAH
jgi:hypothetical protein